jgi:starch phosphorylase
MAYLAIRGSGAVNGVSRLHGEVSRHIFGRLFPRWPVAEVPVATSPTAFMCRRWDAAASDELWTAPAAKIVGAGRRRRRQPHPPAADEPLWSCRNASRESLIGYARERLARQWAAAGATAEEIEAAQPGIRPGCADAGFARRFATYKRPNLLLHDPERLRRC